MKMTPEKYFQAIAESRRLLKAFEERTEEPLAAAICACAIIIGYSEGRGVDLQVFIDFMKSHDTVAFAKALGVGRGDPQ